MEGVGEVADEEWRFSLDVQNETATKPAADEGVGQDR